MIIAVATNKGGVGKTAITANLAHALANKGKRVLVVDYDSQSNSTNILLGESMPSHTLNDVLLGKAPINRAISATPYDNLDVLANESITAALEVMFYKDLPNSYYLLRSMLNPIRDKYDLLLLDTPPSLGHWTIQALTAADAVIVPIDASSKHSLQGLNAAIRAIKDISDSFNPGVCFYEPSSTKWTDAPPYQRQWLSRYQESGRNSCSTQVSRPVQQSRKLKRHQKQ